jgi:hypothetical protein
MMSKIDGFTFVPTSGNLFLARRMTEPRHAYHMEINSKRVRLIEFVPVDVAHGDPWVDAQRFEPEAIKAARKLQRSIFSAKSRTASLADDPSPLPRHTPPDPNRPDLATPRLAVPDRGDAPRLAVMLRRY